MSFGFAVEAVDGRARAGVLRTPHGEVQTPVFMPVGTQGTVKGMRPRDLREMGVRMLLGNTYHLLLRPGHDLVREMGGLHRFMAWDGAILTDSGGYQVLSLSTLRQVSEEGVRFRSHIDGSSHHLTPERVMEIQDALGSDVAMPLDVLPPAGAPETELEEAVERSARWLARAVKARRRPGEQALFGIVQGGTNPGLRRRSVELTTACDLEGYAIGGLGIGEAKERTYDTIDRVAGSLPAARPRYLMGMGTPTDLVEAVARGVDMFDCVLPTRNARNSGAFTSEGSLNLRNARFRADPRPLDPACRCPTCTTFSRAYLRHLVVAGELLAPILLTVHNLSHFLDTMERIRQSIVARRFEELLRSVRDTFRGERAEGAAGA